MNKLLKIAALTAAVAMSIPAAEAAGTATAPFNVIANLTAACRISTAPTDITLNYTAFQGTAATGTSNFVVQCSNTLLYSITMPLSTADNINTNLGLTNSVAITAGGSTNVSGTAAGNSHTITASIASGQAGTCATSPPGTCTATNGYTLTVTY